jgi:protein SCO1
MAKTQRGAAAAALMVFVWAIAVLRPPRVAADSRWGATYFPDVTLTTQDGERVKFYDLIKGRIVAIDLIYTTCQYACPLESARLARMQQLLGARMGKDVFFISISIDPEHDTPAALKAYAEKYEAGPGWIFLTGDKNDIDRLSKKLGLWSDPTLTQDGHTPMLLIGNEPAGQWTMTSALDNPSYTAKIIGNWMSSWRTPTVGKTSTEAKPIARDNGKYLFSSLCANCHAIGGRPKIGPDLSVSLDARDRSWLVEYSQHPDVMRAKNDPIAKMLMAKYPTVRMPNLSLNVDEIKQILNYVEMQKSHRAAELPARPAAQTASAATANVAAPAALVQPALAIQSALAADTMVGVMGQAAALRQAAAAIGAPAAAIETAAADLVKQTTIEDARRAFGALADALLAYARAAELSFGEGVRVGYCPMVRKSWLQKDGAVANPYYGSRMLNCGELTN